MKHKGQLALGLLLALSLIWAYRIAHPPAGKPSRGTETITIWELSLRDIARVTYRDGKKEVVLEPDWKDRNGTPYIWVKSRLPKPSRRRRPAKAPPLVSAAFKGNAQAEKVIEFFARAKARRMIGRLKALKAADFGFPSKERWVEITLGSGQPARRLELGRNLFGNSGTYVHTPHDGGVYLMPARFFRQFSRASTAWIDRRVLSLSPAAAVRAEVSFGGRSVTVWRLAGKGQWARSPDADGGQETAGAVMKRLGTLRVLDYPPEPPKGLSAMETPQLEIRFFGKENAAPLESLSLFIGKGNTFQARSFHTRKKVNIRKQQVLPLMQKIRELFRET
ncbi:MAG: DUF4340 domain-containing protein [bacterium]